MHFLVAWSLFESKCIKANANEKTIQVFATQAAISLQSKHPTLEIIGDHFYIRYQNKKMLSNLLYGREGGKLKEILTKPKKLLTDLDIIFLVAFVIFRFRNNIFHGNKGVNSWLQFEEQIKFCTSAMQIFISHEENIQSTIKA